MFDNDCLDLIVFNAQDGIEYAVCSFCDFQVRKSRVMCHLISECYMAPCPLCGDKLIRRNDRVTHRKVHKDVFDRWIYYYIVYLIRMVNLLLHCLSKWGQTSYPFPNSTSHFYSFVTFRFMCECRRGFSHFYAFMEHQCRTRTLPTVTCTACNVKFVGSLNSGRTKVLNDSADHFIVSHNSFLFPLGLTWEWKTLLRNSSLFYRLVWGLWKNLFNVDDICRASTCTTNLT